MSNLRKAVNFSGAHNDQSLLNHFGQSTITPAVCCYLKSAIDNTEIGLTSFNHDLSGLTGYPGVTFKTVGVTPSKAEQLDQSQPTNLETDVLMAASGITEADVTAGKWTDAKCTVFLINYNDLTMGQLIVSKGKLSAFVQRGRMLRADVRGHNQALGQYIGRVTRPECDADLGDARCGLDLAARGEIHTVTVTTVTSQTVFRASALTQTGDYFQNARGKWLTGANANFPIHVNKWDTANKEFTLRTPAPYMPQVGDTAEIKRGCRKRALEDCTTKFANILNYRGQKDIPTIEDITRLPLS